MISTDMNIMDTRINGDRLEVDEQVLIRLDGGAHGRLCPDIGRCGTSQEAIEKLSQWSSPGLAWQTGQGHHIFFSSFLSFYLPLSLALTLAR